MVNKLNKPVEHNQKYKTKFTLLQINKPQYAFYLQILNSD